MTQARHVVIWAPLIAALACGEGGDGPSGPATPVPPAVNPILHIELTGPSGPLVVGEKVKVVIITRVAGGTEVTGRQIAWSSSNTSVATVTAAGEVSAVGSGLATIFARADGVTAQAAVAVSVMQIVEAGDVYAAGTLAFSSRRFGTDDIFVVGPGGLTRVTSTADNDRPISWTPAGDRIGFLRITDIGGSRSSHTVGTISGSESIESAGTAAWTFDWTKVVTFSQETVVIRSSDGSSGIRVPGAGFLEGAWWSPDGKVLAISMRPATGQPLDIFLVDADGSNLRNATNTPTRGEIAADWHPDGRSLLVEAATPTGEGALYLQLLSGASSQLATGGGASDARWSPDGSKIVFTTLRDGLSALYVMTLTSTPYRLSPQSISAFGGRWSPDGSRIAFSGAATGQSNDLYVINADRSSLVHIAGNPAAESSPLWKR